MSRASSRCGMRTALRGRHVLLVDDVFTTGATIISCGSAIMAAAGDVRLSVATLAVPRKRLARSRDGGRRRQPRREIWKKTLPFGGNCVILELENYTLFMAKEFTPSASNRAAYDKMTDTPVAGVVPPQAVELEETVLGALMLEKDSIIAVQEYITADAFYTEEAPTHIQGHRVALGRTQAHRPLYRNRTPEGPQGAQEGGRSGISRAADAEGRVGGQHRVPCQDHSPEICPARADTLGYGDPAPLLRRGSGCDGSDRFAESEIFKVAEGHVKRSVQNAKDILAKALAQIEQASKNTSAFNGVPSGFMAIDRVTLGWQPSDLIIIAARPSMERRPSCCRWRATWPSITRPP